MSTLSSKVLVLAFASLAIASQACTLASPTDVELVPAKQDGAATDPKTANAQPGGGSGGTAGKCDAKLVKVDASKLTACGDGAGHCYPKSKTPGADKMMPCPKADEVCVSDTILKAGGDKLKSCKVEVLSNAAGACLPIGTMPEGSDKEQAKANLKQDACDAGELCAPCANPLQGGADTGICGAVGVSDGECGGGATTAGGGDATKSAGAPAATCCGGKGTCLNAAGLPDAGLPQDSCSAGLLCAPESLVSNKAKTCKAGAILGNGICMNGCFNDTLDTLGAVFLDKGDTCDDGDLCVPCTFASKMAPDGVKVPGCE